MAKADERGKLIFGKMGRDIARLGAEQNADRVHSFRTTARRVQTLFEVLLTNPGRKQKKLLKTLNRIRKRAGRVRDLDVQLSALRSLKVSFQPRRKTQLMQELLELRAQHEKDLRKLLTKSEVWELKKRLKQAAKTAKLESIRDPLAEAKQILASAQVGSEDKEELLHRYRLAVKRARYTAEFAPKSADAIQLIRQLKRLQDALGNWHDWMMLTHSAIQRFGEVGQSPLVAALHSVTRAKFRHAVAALSAGPVAKSGAGLGLARKLPLQGESKGSAPLSSAA